MKSYPVPFGDETSAGKAAPTTGEAGSGSRKALLLAALFGIVGAALLMLYLHRFEEEVSGGSRVPLLTVLKPVPRGTLLTADMLTVIEVPLAYVEQRAVKVADRSKIMGVRTANALAAQDTLMWSDLALSTEQRDLSSLVQPGKRAVMIEADEINSSNGLLRPGDYVDVLVTLKGDQGASPTSAAIVLLQRVLLLAVGSETQAQAIEDVRAGSRARELTLSLKVEEAQLLALARQRGTLSVALRAPQDFKVIENIPDMPLSSLYDKTSRENLQKRREPAAPSSNGPVRVPGSTP